MTRRLNHDDIRDYGFPLFEENGERGWGYEYHRSLKYKYRFIFEDWLFAIGGWCELWNLFDEFTKGVCPLRGNKEPWAPGENPKGRYSKDGKNKNRWRYFHVDHDPKRDPKVYGIFSIRGLIDHRENDFLKYLDKHPELAAGVYKEYMENPPFQVFLEKLIGSKKYRELLEEIENGLQKNRL
tara:strand:- start:662 stop:1207 length:546 start_codon:yes stop_codon:yes gene_type:complete